MEPEKITINIKTVGSPALTVSVVATASVEEVKQEIKKSNGIEVSKQKLVSKGKHQSGRILKDSDTLSGVQVKDNDTLHLVRFIQVIAKDKPAAPAGTTTTAQPDSNQPAASPQPGAANPFAAFGGMGGMPGMGMPGMGMPGMGMPGMGMPGMGMPGMGMPGMGMPGMAGNPMAAMMGNPQMMMRMMQDPNVQAMMRSMLSNPQMMQNLIGSNPMLQQMMGSNPEVREMLSNPAMMQEAMGQMFGGGMPAGGVEGAGAMPGLGFPAAGFPSPAANPAAPQVPAADPRVTYASQLQQLRDMGFADDEASIRALQATRGNVEAAVERLLSS